MKHKYLDKIIKEKPFFYKHTIRPKYLKEKHQHSFDEREVISLDYTFYCWLYEHIKVYMEKAENEPFLDNRKIEWNGHEYTQKELIYELINRLDKYFSREYYWWDNVSYVKQAGEIWGVLLPFMRL